MTLREGPPYEFRRLNRRPFLVLAFLVASGLFYTGLSIGAPNAVLVMWGIATAALLVAVVVNRQSGLSIADGHLRIVDGVRRSEVPLSDIARVTMTRWSEGPGEWVIELNGGRRIALPAMAVPPGEQLADALESRGVPVELRRVRDRRG
jgi:hypothetical protein